MPDVRACAVADLADGMPLRVELDGRPVCLVRLDDTIHAIGDTCSHEDISLSEGEVDAADCTIECWSHGSRFSLTDGVPLALPATKPVPVYEARIEGDDVMLEMGDE